MKNFTLQKNNKKSDKQPDYKISVNIGEEKSEFVEAGACWIKQDKNGKPYLSCKLSDVYVDHTKNVARKGFNLVMEGQTEAVKEYGVMNDEPDLADDVGF